jgi:hypothetical protein
VPVGMMAPVPLPAASGCSGIGQPTFAALQAVTRMRRKGHSSCFVLALEHLSHFGLWRACSVTKRSSLVQFASGLDNGISDRDGGETSSMMVALSKELQTTNWESLSITL